MVLVGPVAPSVRVAAVAAVPEHSHPLVEVVACQQLAQLADVARVAVKAWVAVKVWVAADAADQA